MIGMSQQSVCRASLLIGEKFIENFAGYFQSCNETFPLHLHRLLQPQQIHQGRGNILERTAVLQGTALMSFTDQNQRHRIQGMGRMRLLGFQVDHSLGIAVIRRDQQGATHFLNLFGNPPQAKIHGFTCLH